MKKVYASMLCFLLITMWGSSLALAYAMEIPLHTVLSCPNTELAHPGDNLIDGRRDTFWRIRPNTQEGWVILEFATSSLVDGVYIEGILMPNSQLILEYEYDGYWNPIVGGVIRELPSNGFVDLSYARIVADKLRVRLQGVDVQGSSIAELKIHGQPATTVLHRIEPVEMLVSDSSSAFYPLRHLFDGNTKTTWSTNSHYEEVIIKLDEHYRLDHLNIFFSEQANGMFYLDARTEEGWSELVTITQYPRGRWHKVDLSTFNLATDYVRLRVSGSGETLGGLGELELWGYGEYQGRFTETVLNDAQFVLHQPLNLAFEVNGNVGWSDNPQVPHQSLQVLYKSTSLNQHTTSLQHNICLVNTGALPIDLSSVVLRYWYTAESTSEQIAEIYWSNIGQSNVITKFVALDSVLPNADRYLEIGFTEQAGILGPQTEIELHLGIHAQNWEMYDQSNDHSFRSDARKYVENLNYTGYIDGFIAWGNEPKEQVETVEMSAAFRSTIFAMGEIAEPELTILYTTKNTKEFTNSIQHNIQLVNSGSTPVDLGSVLLRYWYNNEPFKEQKASIYWSNIGEGNIIPRFVELEKYIPEANQYLELGFSKQAGMLLPGMTVEIHLGFNTFDWSNYNQYNDYSFNPEASSFIENTKYTAYIQDKLNWGQEPKGLGAGDLGDYRIYALDLVIDDENDRSLHIELNGKAMEIVPTFFKRGQTFYQQILPDEYLKAGMNSLRVLPDGLGIEVNHLQVTSYTRDGMVPLVSDKYNGHPLRFTPATSNSEVSVLFGQTSLLGEVHVFSGDFEGSVFALKNNQWVQIPLVKEQKGMRVFALPVVTDQIRIWNPSYAVIEAVEVLGSPVSDQGPVVQILEPMEDAIIDLSKEDLQLIGFVDDAQASVEVNGRAVPLRGHYFSVPLKQLGLFSGQQNRITIVAHDRHGRHSLVERTLYIGSSLSLELDQADEWVITDEPYFTLSGRVERDSLHVYVNDQLVNLHGKTFSTAVNLQEGFNELVVRVVDQQSGAVAKAIRKVLYQKPFIQLTVDEPLHGSFVKQDSVIVAGRVEASRTATITINGSLVDLVQGRFRSDEVPLVEGDNSIIIRAEDIKGLAAEQKVVVHYDSKAPEISDVTPQASYITADAKVRFTGKVQDVNPVRVFVNGHVVPVEGGIFALELSLSEGFHNVEILAQDLAGNISNYVIENIIVDLTPPENFSIFADPDGWTSNIQPILTFSTTDAISGISHYEFSMYGQPYIAVESPFRIPHLADGEHEVKIKAVDRSGRETVSSTTVYIDTTPPETPETFRVIPGNGRMVLKWDPSSPDTVEYWVEEGNGQRYTVTETELILPNLPNGSVLEFRVWAVDRAGNEGAPTDWKQGTIGVAEAVYDPEQGAIVEYDTVVLAMPNVGLPEGVAEIQVAEITSEYLEEKSVFPFIGPIYEFSAFMEGQDVPLENLTIDGGYLGQIAYDPALIPEGFPEQNLGVYYYDSLFDRWLLIESSAVDVENNTIYFLTNHFTSFSVQPTLITDLTPQEYKDAGYSPLNTYSTHEGVSVSPQGGTASTRQTELVLPGINGFDFILERRYDTATARSDSGSLDLNIKIGLNLFSASGLRSPKEILETVEIYRTDVNLPQTILNAAQKYISQQGDYAYSMGNGWRLNIPYIKTNNSALMVGTPDGNMYSMSEMDLVSFISLPKARVLRMEQHEGDNFTLDIKQVEGAFPAVDSNNKLTLKNNWSGLEYTLTLSDGTTYEMDALGRTTKMIDPSGLQEITFHYNGLLLNYIEDTVGRKVRFAYEMTNPWSLPRISKIWVENDPVYNREIQYGRGQDGTLTWAKDIANRTSRYEYGDHLMFGGTAGVKVNIVSIISKFMGNFVQGTLSSIFGVHDVELFGSLTTQLVSPLKQVEAVGQGVVTIGYDQPTVAYGSTKIDWFLILPTSVTFSLNLQQRLLANEVRVYETIGGPLVKKTTFDYAIDYHSEGQPFIKKTETYDGAKRIVYHYSDLVKTRKRWEDGYKKIGLPEGVPIDASIWFPVRFWNKEIVPVNTRIEIYQGQSDWLLKVHDMRWDPNKLLPLEQTVWRGDHYQKLTYAYDNWGNVTHLTDHSEVHGRVNKLERWAYYANTQSSPGSSQPWRTSPYAGQTINQNHRNLPLGELVANYTPTESGTQSVTYLQTNHQYNERGQRLASSSWDGEEWLESQFTYDQRTGNLIEHRNPNDHRTLYEYDEYGLPAARIEKDVVDASGAKTDLVTRFGYERISGWKLWEQDPRGYRTEYRYDTLGRVVEIKEPADNGRDQLKTTVQYDDLKLESLVTDPLGNKIRYTYNPLGQLKEEIKYKQDGSVGAKVTLTYDGWGNVTSLTDPNNHTTLYEYDALGRTTKVSHPTTSGERPETRMEMDYRDNTLTTWDENNNRVVELLDMQERVIERTAYDWIHTIKTEHYFDGFGNEVMSKDPKGSITVNKYNTLNQLVETILPAEDVWENGQRLTGVKPYQRFEYNKSGYLTRIITNASGNQEQVLWYETDGLGRVIKMVQAPGTANEAVTETYYDANGNVIRKVDANNTPLPKAQQKAFTYVYSARDLVVEETDPAGNTVSYVYDANKNLISLTDPRGNSGKYAGDFTIEYSYDELNRLVAGFLPKSKEQTTKPVVRLEYDARGNLLKRIEPDGGQTLYSYTPRNWVEEVKVQGDGKEYSTHYRYDLVGNQTGIIDGTGAEIRQSFDGFNRLVLVEYPEGNAEAFTYDENNNQIGLMDGRNWTEFRYDRYNRLIEQKDALNGRVQYRYDRLGNQTEMINALGHRYQYQYDELNRLIQEEDAQQNRYSYSYDLVGNRASAQDPNGTNYQYSYYPNHLVQEIELTNGAKRNTLNYLYDEAGYLKHVQDGDVVTSYNTKSNVYTPDPFGRVYAESTLLDGKTFTTEYTYDVLGRLTGVGTPNGEWVSYEYNKLGELTKVPSYVKQSPTYDRVGRLTDLVAANGVTQKLSYDQNHRLVELSYQGQGERFKEYSYGYDQANNMVRKNNNQFSYDALNQLVFASLVGSFEIKGEDYPLLKGRAFNDHFGQEELQFNVAESDLVELDYAAGSIGVNLQNSFPVTRVELSPDSPVHRVHGKSIKLYVSANGYTYQEVEDWTAEAMEDGGLRLLLHTPTQARYVKVQSLFDDRDVNFDPVNKAEFKNQAKDLIDVYYLVTARQEEYQYDAGGNRSQATITERQAKQTGYQYYPNSNRLMTNGEYGFIYDANGNLIAKGTKYTNSGNSLTIQPEGEYWNYHYDLLNRLISVEKNGKTIAAYKYNEKGLRIKKLAFEATTYYSFNLDDQVVYEQTSESTLSYVYVLGQHFAMIEEETKYFYHTDHLGSTVLVTNNDGQEVWSNEYTPFGQLTVETSFFTQAIKFTGKDLDPDTGLYYFNARWYDSSLGRFISEDPIKDGLNWYTYVMNNPLRYVDPTGLMPYVFDQIDLGLPPQRQIERERVSYPTEYTLTPPQNLTVPIKVEQKHTETYAFGAGKIEVKTSYSFKAVPGSPVQFTEDTAYYENNGVSMSADITTNTVEGSLKAGDKKIVLTGDSSSAGYLELKGFFHAEGNTKNFKFEHDIQIMPTSFIPFKNVVDGYAPFISHELKISDTEGYFEASRKTTVYLNRWTRDAGGIAVIGLSGTAALPILFELSDIIDKWNHTLPQPHYFK